MHERLLSNETHRHAVSTEYDLRRRRQMSQQNQLNRYWFIVLTLTMFAYFLLIPFSEAKQGVTGEKEVIRHPNPIKHPDDESLIKAVEGRNLDAMKQAITHGANVNSARKNGQTSLMTASRLANTTMVKALIVAGAKLNIETKKSGLTALKLAAREGHTTVVDVLLDAGADVDHRGGNNQGDAFAGASALAHAAANGRSAMVTHLISRGANPNLENYMSLTPIMYAAGEGKLESVKALLKAGVLADHASSLGLTPLMAAAKEYGQWKLMAYLLGAGANPNQQISDTTKALGPDAPGMTALMLSVLVGDKESFFTILLSGANPSLKRADGKTALDLAMDRLKEAKTDESEYKRMEPIQRALFLPDWGKKKALEVVAEELENEIERNNVDIVTAGLRLGVDPNVLIDENEPLFFEAIKGGNLPLVKLMLKHGADPNVKDRRGGTAFYLSMYREQFDIARLLIAQGADPNILLPETDETLLHEFAGNGHVEGVKLLVRAGIRVDVRDSSQNTPLHVAANQGELETFKILLDAGADPTLKNEYGDRPTDQVFDKTKTPLFLELLPGFTTPIPVSEKPNASAPTPSQPRTWQEQVAAESESKPGEFDLGDLDF